jgi:hypothetical protein
MPRPPNYKQNKQRREDAKRKKNEEAQARKTARKSAATGEAEADGTPSSGKPDGP